MIMNKEKEDYFKKRTKKHISLVNHYAKKLGRVYPEHDSDKFSGDLYEPYVIYQWSVYTKEPLSEEEMKMIDKATLDHIIKTTHHPEFHDPDKRKFVGFTRNKPINNVDATNMPKEDIYEMCCDWCAVSKELSSNPYDWMRKTVGNRWLFSNSQVKLIENTLDKLWYSNNIKEYLEK